MSVERQSYPYASADHQRRDFAQDIAAVLSRGHILGGVDLSYMAPRYFYAAEGVTQMITQPPLKLLIQEGGVDLGSNAYKNNVYFFDRNTAQEDELEKFKATVDLRLWAGSDKRSEGAAAERMRLAAMAQKESPTETDYSYPIPDLIIANGHPDINLARDPATMVATVAFARRRTERSILLVREDENPKWEIPTGHNDLGEPSIQAAQRTLQEVAGTKARYWHQLPSQLPQYPQQPNAFLDVLVASEVTQEHGYPDPDMTERVFERKWFPVAEVEDMMRDGRIKTGHTMASLSLANTFLDRYPAYLPS